MKCQILFSRKSKKNITNLSSAESAHSVVKLPINSIIIRSNLEDTPVWMDGCNFDVLQPFNFIFKGENLRHSKQ